MNRGFFGQNLEGGGMAGELEEESCNTNNQEDRRKEGRRL